MKEDFIENVHFYYENGAVVMTALFHLQRGFCCGNKCRHCPYEPLHKKGNTEKKDDNNYENIYYFCKNKKI